jgi:hypothetical protein
MTAPLPTEATTSRSTTSPLNPDSVLLVGLEKEEVPCSAEVVNKLSEQAETLFPSTPETPTLQLRSGPKDYTLPKCSMPPMSELQPIETFVMNAVQSQHEETADHAFAQGYRAIADALRRTSDPPMLRKVLIALRIAGKGNVLNLLASHPTKHAQLTHLIFRFDSTSPPAGLAYGMDRAKEKELFKIYKDGSMLDAHLHLILALVSAKSVNVVPALTMVWKMIYQRPMPKFM